MKLSFTPNDPHSILLVLESIRDVSVGELSNMEGDEDEYDMLAETLEALEAFIIEVEEIIAEHE